MKAVLFMRKEAAALVEGELGLAAGLAVVVAALLVLILAVHLALVVPLIVSGDSSSPCANSAAPEFDQHTVWVG